MIPRIYTIAELKEGIEVRLQDQQMHYLINVLRLKNGEVIRVFNERDGEWQGSISNPNKKQLLVQNLQFFCAPKLCKPLWLAFALIKHDPLDFLLEKSTELGATHLQPLITERCNIKNIRLDRWQKNVIDATQQSERHDVPQIFPVQNLKDFLKNQSDVHWLACVERKNDVTPILKAVQKLDLNQICGFIIGPEGGFSEFEQNLLLNTESVGCISLGWRILRAETAAINVLSCYQAINR